MRHFVGYHNPTRMGYSAFTDADPLSLYTSKSYSDMLGGIVWMVTSQGKPKKTYYLSSWFVIDEVTASDDTVFGYIVRGRQGGLPDPVPVLSDEEWFPAFRRRMANFSLGLQEIRDPDVITAVRQLTRDAGCPQTG